MRDNVLTLMTMRLSPLQCIMVIGSRPLTGQSTTVKKLRDNPGITTRGLQDRIAVRPLNMVSIDPGDIHVGFVSWNQGVPDHLEEYTPEECCQVIEHLAQTSWLDVVVIEEWRLYPTMTDKMVGSDFPTCQLIGILKYILDGAGIAYHLQPAQAKYPTMGVLRNSRFQLISKRIGASNHVQDAELHGWYFQFVGHKQFHQNTGINFEKGAA